MNEQPRALRLCGTCAVDGEPVGATGQLLVLLAVLGVRGERVAARDELAHLRERPSEALEFVARRGLDGDATADDVRVGVRIARELVELTALMERPTALLMELLEAHGDRAAAVVAYDRLRRGLLDELAMAPGPGLRDTTPGC